MASINFNEDVPFVNKEQLEILRQNYEGPKYFNDEWNQYTKWDNSYGDKKKV